MHPLNWSTAHSIPTLGSCEVHLWRANLDASQAIEDFRATLSIGEILRADSFATEIERDRFIAARGTLRLLLAQYTNTHAHAIRFTFGPFGKPSILGQRIRFNLSQSGDLALIAIALEREVGVDVEQVQEDLPFDEMAERYFEPEEIWDIRIARGTQRAWKFFDVWTSTEARLKAIGRPSHERSRRCDRFGLRSFSVLNEPSAAVRREYAAALAMEGIDWQLKCWEWRN